MKKTLTIFLLLCCTAALTAAHQYAPHSRLKDGKVVKMRISESGVYLVSYDDIVAAGLNPSTTGVLGYGGALLSQDFSLPHIDDLPPVAVYRYKGTDGTFGKGDYLLFYGQGPISWSYNGSYFTHTRNHTSDYGYYFLSDAEGSLLEMPTAEALNGDNAISEESYTNYILHEKELVNLLDVNNGIDGGGREFYGERINNNSTLNLSFTLPNIDATQTMGALVNLAATGRVVSTYTVVMGDKNKQVKMANIQDNYTRATLNQTRLTNIAPQSNMRLSITLNSEQESTYGYLNYVELMIPTRLQLDANSLLFRSEKHYEENVVSEFRISGTDQTTEIWDITDKENITRIPTFQSNDKLCFYGSNKEIHEYVAVRTRGSNFMRPTILGQIKNQDLHSLKDIDLVIVTPEAFRSESERLGEAHWQKDALTYAVVSDQEVYNEFSSGTPDVSAIRWLMKMLYDRSKSGQSTAPKYLLLMGDGTFDNRQLLPLSGKNTLITYQATNSSVETKAYATDDYFGFLEDKDGMAGNYYSDIYGIMRIGVGRLPVNTNEEARQVVDKLIGYMYNPNRGKWQQRLCFLADDGDHGQHTKISDAAAELVRVKAQDFIVEKIYLDAYQQEKTASTESYPLAYNRYTNMLKTGVLFMDYTGHGSSNNICNELFLTLSSVQQMQNKNLGFWMLATCNYAHFDKAAISSAEAAVLNPNGGAIGVISACRTVYASENDIINQHLCDTLLGHSDAYTYDMTIGEAVRIAKNMCGNSENKLPYILLADPALRLDYPTGHTVVTSEKPDTLKALGTVTISGFIRTQDGDTAHEFNGNLEVSIYDKLQRITTRDNDEADPQKKQLYTYNDYSNLLFTGSTDVKNGLFTFEFRMPKDIRYNYDAGRIVYCATDTINEWEAIGHDHEIIVGGSDSASLSNTDTIGPNLYIYLDNPAFVSGGKTSEYPHFYANIEDESGINTIGNGIGHDLKLTIDNDTKQTYILNNFFTSESGSYTAGQVSYTLPLQSAGQHFLEFRAWDLYNNSSVARLSYEVVKGLSPRLYEVLIAPNPCVPSTPIRITISTDRPDEALKSSLSVYSISGEEVLALGWTEDRVLQFIPAQHHMTAGIYVLKLEMRTDNSSTSKHISKLIVL